MTRLTEARLAAGDRRLFPWSGVTVDSRNRIHWNIEPLKAMNCEDVPSGEDWGDVTEERRETMEQFYDVSEVIFITGSPENPKVGDFVVFKN